MCHQAHFTVVFLLLHLRKIAVRDYCVDVEAGEVIPKFEEASFQTQPFMGI